MRLFVGSTVIPTASTVRKIAGAVLPLLEEENRQENDPNTSQQALSSMRLMISLAPLSTIGYALLEDAVCLVQVFKEPFISHFKLRS